MKLFQYLSWGIKIQSAAAERDTCLSQNRWETEILEVIADSDTFHVISLQGRQMQALVEYELPVWACCLDYQRWDNCTEVC